MAFQHRLWRLLLEPIHILLVPLSTTCPDDEGKEDQTSEPGPTLIGEIVLEEKLEIENADPAATQDLQASPSDEPIELENSRADDVSENSQAETAEVPAEDSELKKVREQLEKARKDLEKSREQHSRLKEVVEQKILEAVKEKLDRDAHQNQIEKAKTEIDLLLKSTKKLQSDYQKSRQTNQETA